MFSFSFQEFWASKLTTKKNFLWLKEFRFVVTLSDNPQHSMDEANISCNNNNTNNTNNNHTCIIIKWISLGATTAWHLTTIDIHNRYHNFLIYTFHSVYIYFNLRKRKFDLRKFFIKQSIAFLVTYFSLFDSEIRNTDLSYTRQIQSGLVLPWK